MSAPRRIGILCVHGIGDQQRSQHVDIVGRQFHRHLMAIYGAENVLIDALPGVHAGQLLPDITFAVRTQSGLVLFDLVEVWWRDLGERPGFKHAVKFWWWALTLWTTSGFGAMPTTGRVLPKREGISKTRTFSINSKERLRLFFQSVSFFVLLMPAQLALSLISLIPFVRKINFFQSVYAYLSSVKIYQQEKNDTYQDVLDRVISRRVRIQKRLTNLLVLMAESNFDRWFVLAHSLGSVIALKTLMYDGNAFARSFTRDRWGRLPQSFKTKEERNSNFVDKPPLPWWLDPADSINLQTVYAKFGGVVTYGSPIETFATLWPSIIELDSRTEHFGAHWINLYDRRDFISSKILSLDALSGSLPLLNIEVQSHWLIPKSHTNYLSPSTRSAKVVQDVLRWMAGEYSINELQERTRSKPRSVRVAIAIAVQVVAILTIGATIFPVALWGLWNAMLGSIKFLDTLVPAGSLPKGFYQFLEAGSDHIKSMMVHLDDAGNLAYDGLFESLLIVTVVLLVFGFLKFCIMRIFRPSTRIVR